jgi:hypothetical protein
MAVSLTAQPESVFMHKNIPLFLKRFSLSYFREDSCIEYFIGKPNSIETISSSLVLSYYLPKKDLHVSRFYPELYLRSNSKYLSAACFYIVIQHCTECFSLDDTCHISLETVENISDSFYRKLGDFNFNVSRHFVGNVVELVSGIVKSNVDTSIIKEHIYQPGEIPFMK